MKKSPIFIRPTNICALPLGIDLISQEFRILANLGGEEKKIAQFCFLKNKSAQKTRPIAEIVRSAEKEINQLKKDFEVWLLPYQPSEELAKLCRKNNWGQAFNDPKLAKNLESKNNLAKFFKNENFLIPAQNYNREKISYSALAKKWGAKFVAQFIPRFGLQPSGGKSTFFIKNSDDFISFLEKVGKNDSIRISKFVNGNAFAMNGCFVGKKLISAGPFTQLIGIPEIDNHHVGYRGFDCSIGTNSDEIKKQSREIQKVVRKKLLEINYRGYFGIDLIFDEKEKKLYLVEINPRMSGSTGIMNYIQKKFGDCSLLANHIRAFLGEKIENENKKAKSKLRGSLILIRSLEKNKMKIAKIPKSGIYEITENELKFLRAGWSPTQVKSQNEVLIFGLVPTNFRAKNGERIANIFSWKSVSRGSYELRPKFAKAAKWIYRQFKFAK